MSVATMLQCHLSNKVITGDLYENIFLITMTVKQQCDTKVSETTERSILNKKMNG